MTRTALYRHFGADGALLYVGISHQVILRTKQHVETATWAEGINQITVEWFETRDMALAAENAAITSERPLFNKRNSVTDTGRLIPDLISLWPVRTKFAQDVGVDIQVVHKWVQSGRIPSGWMRSVVDAAQDRGMAWVTADWILDAHSPKAVTQ